MRTPVVSVDGFCGGGGASTAILRGTGFALRDEPEMVEPKLEDA